MRDAIWNKICSSHADNGWPWLHMAGRAIGKRPSGSFTAQGLQSTAFGGEVGQRFPAMPEPPMPWLSPRASHGLAVQTAPKVSFEVLLHEGFPRSLAPMVHRSLAPRISPEVLLQRAEQTAGKPEGRADSWKTKGPNRHQENPKAKQTAGKPEGRTDSWKTRGPNKQLENPRAEQTAGKPEGRTHNWKTRGPNRQLETSTKNSSSRRSKNLVQPRLDNGAERLRTARSIFFNIRILPQMLDHFT